MSLLLLTNRECLHIRTPINEIKILALQESILGSSKTSSKNTVSCRRTPFLIQKSMANIGIGDVVRIAPNELVFLTPQAAKGQFPAGVAYLGAFIMLIRRRDQTYTSRKIKIWNCLSKSDMTPWTLEMGVSPARPTPSNTARSQRSLHLPSARGILKRRRRPFTNMWTFLCSE